MKIKKLIALATTALVGASIFAGCSSTATSKKSDVVTLKWYTIGAEPKDLQLVEDEANKYLEEKIGVNIDMNFIDYGEYSQKLGVIINSGEAYDLAFTCSWAGDYLGNARKGAFLDLTPYLDNIGSEMKEAIDDRFWSGAEVDGGIYAVPNQKEICTAPMWVFTKEYVDKYNIPYTELHSLEDLEPWLKLIKENEPDVTPLYITKGFSAPQYFEQLVDPVGIEYEDDSLVVKNMFETDKMKSTLETLRKYYQAGYINADSATAQDDKSVKRFVTKGDGQPYAEVLWSKDLKYDVVASQITDSYITNASTTGSMIAVSKNSKNPDKAVEFLNLLNTDEYIRNLLNYGIEGTHYESVNDKQIKLTDKASDYSVGYYTLGNLFITKVLDNEPETKWDEFQEFNDAAKESAVLGFKFDTSKVTNEIAAINNVLEEFKSTIYSGSVDVDEYLDKLNKKLKDQGIDRVIEEMQTQLDAWLAEQ
ncbi:ABC transporter substrate-binding protein [Clostridium saudiense]|uniref:ABC transporter substrate-binding protein n=2 Tax=Clostridium TaxID=1485 RepID=A0ABS2FIS1_9CLOT|nr:ABC transporter substrate-binding protein [Clostridium saudiense]MBM6820104.1 ABC transporter substrate-binding protein [Clostridium saudiense]